MAVQLRTPKRLITQYTNKLETIVTKLKGDQLETLSVSSTQGQPSPVFISSCLHRLNEGIGVLDAAISKVEQALQEYASSFAEIDAPEEKEEEDFNEYTKKGEVALTSAFGYSLLLKARAHAFKNSAIFTERSVSKELITRLIDKLDKCSLRSMSMRDQRTLFEQIQVIIAQLKQKGEQFTEETISSEEAISLYMAKNPPQRSHIRFPKGFNDRQRTLILNCMYCSSTHKSADCTQYKSAQERSHYLRDHKLYLICASPQHLSSACKKRACFKYGGLHHTSCCFKGNAVFENAPKKEGSMTQAKKPKESEKELDKWEASWTMEGQVNVVAFSTLQPCEKTTMFLVLESGTEEFASSEKDARKLVDKQVWEDFKRTIERKDDGYYVRLPWKNMNVDLPDNRAIAYRRLLSVWNTLKEDDQLLQQYNSVSKNNRN
ncbi:hypothetical protein OESDEN_03880 [Oesophagostomum dentatum]|uniref:Uncharacterized protein n=1 Tax=Oesophagostomum dentatum TaxID=61180 RepID=A0A0B1TG25_OESDE|nr:hypothetical protein OESDEN_03880 [Oesophagostomum dentatum]